MATLNKTKRHILKTHEGAPAKHINAELQLRRSVMACMLWENQFYEDGKTIADRIAETILLVNSETVAEIAVEAREKFKLRHVPLLLARVLAKNKYPVSKLLERIIQRPDELTEFLAIYWKEKKEPLSSQVKKGLAKAFGKFNEYQLAKYNRDGQIKLRDVLFLSHAKPIGEEQTALWKKLINGELAIPDTWEVALSTGKDKKETWERLIAEKKLGGLALLRNLRNMIEVNVNPSVIKEALINMRVERILPFRFISAAKYAPRFEPELEKAMYKCLAEQERLIGATAILIDHSGSMNDKISLKSEMSRFEVAGAVAILIREICDNVRIFTFSENCIEIAPRRGFAMIDALNKVRNPTSTYLGKAVKFVYDKFPECERIIVITDEQSADPVTNPKSIGYVINVASNRNGIGYGAWLHIDGFSEAIINYIMEYEKSSKS